MPDLRSKQAQEEAEWQKERESLYAEMGRFTTQLTWLKKKLRAQFQEKREV